RPQAYQDHLRAIRDRADRLGARVAGGAVTFTNTDAACANLRDDVARELLEHHIGNNPVAVHSAHTRGQAVDVSSSLPPAVIIDGLPGSSGAVSVEIDVADSDTVGLGPRAVAGSATGGSPMGTIRVTVADDGSLTSEVLPPPPPPPLPANMISNGTILLGL